jgi:hypothetical protein
LSVLRTVIRAYWRAFVLSRTWSHLRFRQSRKCRTR